MRNSTGRAQPNRWTTFLHEQFRAPLNRCTTLLCSVIFGALAVVLLVVAIVALVSR